MAWEAYIAVLNSDLYDHRGVAKALLARIAHLVIGPAEEGQKPDPDEGYCVATQNYLAAQMGLSETEVKRLIKTYAADGWIVIDQFRDKRGYKRNRYMLKDLEAIKARAMRRAEDGEYIRATNPNKARSTSWVHRDTKVSSGHGDTKLEGTVIPSLGAPCAIPGGTVPASVSNRELESESKTTASAKTVVAASSPTDNSIPDGILELLAYFGCKNGTRTTLAAKLVPFLDLYSVTDLKAIIEFGRQSSYWASACYYNDNYPDKLITILKGELPNHWQAAKQVRPKSKNSVIEGVSSLNVRNDRPPVQVNPGWEEYKQKLQQEKEN